MMKNDLKNQCFKHIAPTLVAGAAIFGVTGAIAGFNVIIQDDNNHYLTCNVSELVQDNDGVQVILDDYADCQNYLKESTLTDSLQFFVDGNNTPQAGCTFSQVGLTGNGELLIKAEGECLSTEGVYNVTNLDYNCFIDEDNKAFVLNVPSYDMDDVCDETLPASITAGNVNVTGLTPVEVEFRTQGAIRILPPFTAAKNHVFIANAGQISS